MTDTEATPHPQLPDRARPFRWGYFLSRLLIVLFLLAVAAPDPRSGRHAAA